MTKQLIQPTKTKQAKVIISNLINILKLKLVKKKLKLLDNMIILLGKYQVEVKEVKEIEIKVRINQIKIIKPLNMNHVVKIIRKVQIFQIKPYQKIRRPSMVY